jgi:hypothetical protein
MVKMGNCFNRIHWKAGIIGCILISSVAHPTQIVGGIDGEQLEPETLVVTASVANIITTEENEIEQIVAKCNEAKFKPFLRRILKNHAVRMIYLDNPDFEKYKPKDQIMAFTRAEYKKIIPHAMRYYHVPTRGFFPPGTGDNYGFAEENRAMRAGDIFEYYERNNLQFKLHMLKQNHQIFMLSILRLRIQLGVEPSHPASKYIESAPETAVRELVSIIHNLRGYFTNGLMKNKKYIMDNVDLFHVMSKALEALGLIKALYGDFMHAAHINEFVNDEARLCSFLAHGLPTLGTCPKIRAYFLKLFFQRQDFLKDSFNNIVYKTCVPQDNILYEIIHRNRHYRMLDDMEKLLLLEGDTSDFYPIEAIIFRNNADAPSGRESL